MLNEIKELKSAEIIDTPEGIERFLLSLKEESGGDTSILQTSDGRLCVTKQNQSNNMSDPFSSPSRERIQEMVTERGMPWDEKYAERVIPWWASDERVDRQGDIVLQNWQFDDYQNNPIMLYAHKWDDPPIGTVLNWQVMDRRARNYSGRSLRLMPLFATRDQYEWADTIFRLAKARFLRTGSVGFYSDNIIQVRDPNERMRVGLGNAGVIYDKNNLIEWTVAPVPANQGALQSLSVVARKGLLKGDDLPVVKDIFRSSVVPGSGDSAKLQQIDRAVVDYWNRLFPATKTVSMVDTKALPDSYREAEGSQRCENCASYDPDSTNPETGICRRFKSMCRATMTCDSWTAPKSVEVTKEGTEMVVAEKPSGEPVAVPDRWDAAMDYIDSRYEEHSSAVGQDPRKQTSVGVLQQVFARGANAWDAASDEIRGDATPEDWGYARLESFLTALDSLKYAGEAHDLDLLPTGHPMSEREKVNKAVLSYINRGANRFIKGDFVSWRTGAGMGYGRIDQIEMKGMALAGEDEMEAVPEDPVATVTQVVEGEDGVKACGKQRLMPFSRLKMAPNQFPEQADWRCMDGQRKRLSDMVMSHNAEVKNDPIRLASLGTAVHIFERGMGSYLYDRRGIAESASAEQYAEARVGSYLAALKGGKFQGEAHDQDLLPEAYPGSLKPQAMKAIVQRVVAFEGIDFKPPEGAADEAKRGLEWRRQYGRGGTEVGVARARDIANGKNLSPETVRRMNSYFARHEVDKQGEGFNPDESGYPSAGRIAWALWGGDAAQSWARKVRRQMELRQNKMYEPVGVVGGLRGRMNEASDRYREIYRWVKTAAPEQIQIAVDGVGVRTDVDYSTLGENEAMAKFVSSVLLAAEIGGDPRDPNQTLKFVRGCVAKAIRQRAVEQIAAARAAKFAEADLLASALKFDESMYERDENGRFAPKEGGGGGDDGPSSDAGSDEVSASSASDLGPGTVEEIGADVKEYLSSARDTIRGEWVQPWGAMQRSASATISRLGRLKEGEEDDGRGLARAAITQAAKLATEWDGSSVETNKEYESAVREVSERARGLIQNAKTAGERDDAIRSARDQMQSSVDRVRRNGSLAKTQAKLVKSYAKNRETMNKVKGPVKEALWETNTANRYVIEASDRLHDEGAAAAERALTRLMRQSR